MTVVHWYVERDLEVPPQPSAWLSPLEAEILAGLRFEKRRHDWLRGRWTSKRLAAPLLGVVDWRRLSVLPAPDGVPEVWVDGQRARLTLSLSHTGEDALSMVSAGSVALGCDLETIAPRSVGLEEDFFTGQERGWVAGFSGDARAEATNLVWSAKESALKALRVGLSRDTRSVEVVVGPTTGSADEWESHHEAPTLGRPFNGSLESGKSSLWRPLSVRNRSDGRAFHGWWRRECNRVVTMVMRPRPDRPRRPAGRAAQSRKPKKEWSTGRGF